jgi:hypothetical protein
MSYDYGEAYLSGGIVHFDVSTKKHPDQWAQVSLEDWPSVREKRWSATKRLNGFYVRTTIDGKSMLLHRFIMKPPRRMTIDHKDGQPLNNRRTNLRICTQAQNITFGADRRRGGPKPPKKPKPIAKPHVVRSRLADGSYKEYTYPTRSKFINSRRPKTEQNKADG